MIFLRNFTLLFFLPAFLFSQTPLPVEWAIVKTPPVNLEGEAWSVVNGSDGYLYWASSQPMSQPFKDIVLYKLDEEGNEIWPEPSIFQQTQTEQAYIVREKGGIVYTGGRICDCINLNLICCDLLLVAFDAATGDTLWSQRYDVHGEYEECDGLEIRDDGIFVTGWTREAEETWFDVLVMKTDLNGNIIWQTIWDEGTEKDERQDGHIYVDDEHIFLSGIAGGIPNVATPLSGFDGDAALWKFDLNGNYVHHVTWGYDEIWLDLDDALGMGSDGEHIYAVGYLSPAGNNADFFIRKLDKELNTIWHDEWGGAGGEAGRSITFDDQGFVWVAVNTFSHGDTEDVALLKYNKNGTLMDFFLYDGGANEHAMDILFFNGALYFSGKTTEGNNPSKPFLVKADPAILVGAEEVEGYAGFEALNIFPNPATENCFLELNLPEPLELEIEIIDLNGIRILPIIKQSYAAGKHLIELKTKGCPTGQYVARIRLGERTYSRVFSVLGKN